MATANHWWLDGLVAIALVGLALAIDEGARRLAAAWRARRGPLSADRTGPADPVDPGPDPELVPTG